MPRCVWIVLLAAATCAQAADWPQYRGPDRDGHTTEASGWTGKAWPTEQIWRTNVGRGSAGAIAADGRVYVIGWHGGKPRKGSQGEDVLVCLDLNRGEPIWRQSYAAPYQARTATGDEGQYGGVHATPALNTETGLLYTLGLDGDLRCWNARDEGKPVWAVQLHEKFKVKQRPDVGGGRRDFGFTTSPLLYRDWVIIEVGDAGGTLAAFDQATGRLAWQSQYDGPAGHSTGPVVMQCDGRDLLALLALKDLVLIDPAGKSGSTYATYAWATDYGCNIPAPVPTAPNRLLITSGYNHRRLAALVVGRGRIDNAWQDRRGYATVATPLVMGSRAFTLENSLRATNLATGKQLWQGGGFGHGSMIATADDKLIVFGDGDLALVDPAANSYRELALVERVVRGTCYPHLAMSDGVLLCKDRDGNLVAIRVRP